MTDFSIAKTLIDQFKGAGYLYGWGVLPRLGELALPSGRRALLVTSSYPGSQIPIASIIQSLERHAITILKQVKGAGTNAPREDVDRLAHEINSLRPNLLVSFGGGSTIDALKAANVLATLGASLDDYFGTGLVTQAVRAAGKHLLPHLAIASAASSSAHLTKYANITERSLSQKKLIVDEAIVPFKAAFDYETTLASPAALTIDGAMDGISNALEVLYGAAGKPIYAQILPITLEVLRLVLTYLPLALSDPANVTARYALGLATDLGGYAVMLGGTNGAHLNSFSLVDILSHGRACGLLNPYYTVFFAPAIEEPLRLVAHVYQAAGYLPDDPQELAGRALGVAVAHAMFAFARATGFPTTLLEVPGFSDLHIARALTNARDPQLKMKLENMPIPLTADMLDEYMRPVLVAARTGELGRIKNLE
jgi:alcohol dehydrogenase